MGCDGGTIPKRHELVKGPKKVEKVSGEGPGGGLGVLGPPGSEGRWGWGGVSGFPDTAAPFFPIRRTQNLRTMLIM